MAVLAPVYAPVRNLMLYVTAACNVLCSYCFFEKDSRFMTAETAEKAVEFFYSRNISGVEPKVNINFFGGEPFLADDIIELVIKLARKPRPNVYKEALFAATTNGTVATPRIERLVKDAHMSLLVSLDGDLHANAERPFVSGQPSYPVVARNLPKLVEWAPEVVVRMTYHPKALDLVGNVRHVFGLGAPSIALCPVVEAPWHEHEAALEQAYQELADWYLSEARQGRVPALEITHQFLTQLDYARRGGARPARPCAVGTNILGVDVDGHVLPCHRLFRPQDWLGHVREPVLSDQRWQYVHLSSANLLGCDTCEAKVLCGGGCRAVVAQAGLDLQSGVHPGFCLNTRAHVRAATRIYDTLMAENHTAFQASLRTARPRLAGLAADI